jgi:DNA invertase Pin-like site-specific DNA recombinase
MAIIGYARVSTADQHLDAQLRELQDAKCDKIYQEKASGVKEDRPELSALLDYARAGDTVVICKLDRIARSTKHLLDIIGLLEKKGVTFQVLNICLDTSTPTGKLMLTMLGAIATFEREMMLERQREGIRHAKEKGQYRGRKPTAMAKGKEVMQLVTAGKTKEAIASELNIGVASVYRIIKATRSVK